MQIPSSVYFGVGNLNQLRKRAAQQAETDARTTRNSQGEAFEKLWPAFEARLGEDITGEGDTGFDILSILNQYNQEASTTNRVSMSKHTLHQLYPRSAHKVIRFLEEIGTTEVTEQSQAQKLVSYNPTMRFITAVYFSLTPFGEWVLEHKAPTQTSA